MKAKKLLVAIISVFCMMVSSSCGIGEAISNNVKSVLPDPSLVADCLPTVEANIAAVPMGATSTFITQKGITEIASVLNKSMNAEPTSIKVSYQADGVYTFFYLNEGKRFILAKISYHDASVQKLFEREGDCPAVLESSPTHFTIKDNTKTGIELTFISRSDYTTKKVQIEEKYSTINLIAMCDNYYLIRTEQTVEEKLVQKHHVLGINEGIITSLETIDFKAKFSVGSSLQAVFYNEQSCIILKKTNEGYVFVGISDGITQQVASAENLTCVGDYLIIGYPHESASVVYSLNLDTYLNEEESSIIKSKATKKDKEQLFVIFYDEYNQTLTFNELKSEKSVTVDIYNSAEGVVPKALKKIAVASEGEYGDGIFDIQIVENQSKLYFTCYYFDKNGNKIYCIFNFDFENNIIHYVGVASSPRNPLSLSPTDDGIMLIFFD